MSKLGDIADGKVVVIKHWHGEGHDWRDEAEQVGYWFTYEPTQGELQKLGISAIYVSWLSGRVLRHAKNSKSVRIKGDSYGLGHWVPVNAEAFEVENESDDWGSIDHNGFWSGLCPSCRCIVPVGRNRVKSHFLKNGTFCPGSRSEPLMRMEEEE